MKKIQKLKILVMKDEKPKNELVIPITFNYAASCVVFDLNLSEVPKTFIVDYQASASNIQKRVPAGKFQATDLIKAVEDFLGTHGRNSSLEYYCFNVSTLNDAFIKDTDGIIDYAVLNMLFDEFTEKLLVELQKCKLKEDDFMEILLQTYINTVRHELKEEICATKIGRIYLSSVQKTGAHYKVGFVSAEVEAPDFYTGSPDRKILSSKSVDVDERTQFILFNGHANLFQEAINIAIEEKIHRNVKILKEYHTAVK
jgi:hypothetical protein